MATFNFSGKAVHASENTSFDPLPEGEYGVVIYDVKSEVKAAGKRNAGDTEYIVQLKVLDGQAGANRRFFPRILISPEWEKFGQKEATGNFSFFQFFAPLLNKTVKAFEDEVTAAIEEGEDINLPTPKELLGKKMTVKLKIKDDDYAFEKAKKAAESDGVEFTQTQADFKKNEVVTYKKYAEVEKAKPSLPGAGGGFTL